MTLLPSCWKGYYAIRPTDDCSHETHRVGKRDSKTPECAPLHAKSGSMTAHPAGNQPTSESSTASRCMNLLSDAAQSETWPATKPQLVKGNVRFFGVTGGN